MTPGVAVGEEELIAHCRGNLAHYKAPTRVVIGELQKTATGKIQKFALRELARRLDAGVEHVSLVNIDNGVKQ